MGQVTLREGKGQVEGSIVDVGPAGVGIDVDVAGRKTRRIVGWDRVKSVEGDKAAQPIPMAAMSESLWRARSRLERGDWLAAEPLLIPLENTGSASADSGPTAAVIHEGLLRCRLARNARAGAIGAWLNLLRVYERAGATGEAGWARPATWIGGTIEAGARGAGPSAWVMDAAIGLVPALPPIWVGETAMDVAPSRSWSAPDSDKTTPLGMADEMALWYAVASRFEAGEVSIDWPAARGNSPGVRLARLIVQARTGDAEQRESACDGLRGIMGREGAEPWEESWCRAAIGRSLLRSDDSEARLRGVIQLLHVPARLSDASPHLAAVCLAEAAAAMWELGDRQAAIALKGELTTRFGLHPAAGWAKLRPISSAPAAPAPAPRPEAEQVPIPPRAQRGQR